MAIVAANVKLMESQKLTQDDNAGGFKTSNQVVDGAVNNLFVNLSRDDFTFGNLDLVKAHPLIDTPTEDTFYGTHLIISNPASDPLVHTSMFATGDPGDLRQDAQDFVERYVVKGPLSRVRLWDRQVEGSKAILCLLMVGVIPPAIGDVIFLVEDDGGLAEVEQAFRITDISSEMQEFSSGATTSYFLNVLTITFADALEQDFTGGLPAKDDTAAQGSDESVIRTSIVADAAKYYSVSELSEIATAGDLSIKAESIYTHIVPSTQTSTPFVGIKASEVTAFDVDSGGETFQLLPYVNSADKEITIANQSFSYIFNLQPIPAPGTLVIAYRALGRWYTVTDDGNGALEGAGAGTVNKDNGYVVLTVDAVPDVDTSIILHWGTPAHFIDRAGYTGFERPALVGELGNTVQAATTIDFSWLSATVAKTATADVDGDITGDGTGTFDHATGQYKLIYDTDALPDAGNVTIDFTGGIQVYELKPPGGTPLIGSIQLSNFPVKAGSVTLVGEWISASQTSQTITINPWSTATIPKSVKSRSITTLVDDGVGGFSEDPSAVITYATGVITFAKTRDKTANKYIESTWTEGTDIAKISSDLHCYYQESGVGDAVDQILVPVSDVVMDILGSLVQEYIVPGTLRFDIGGVTHSDRDGQGVLYLNDGTVAGSVNYARGTVTITNPTYTYTTMSITSMVTVKGSWYEWLYKFRTPVAPLQPASLVLTATATDGTLITGTTDVAGVITGDLVRGTINQEVGVGALEFGELVEDSGLSAEEKAEWWYDAGDVDAGWIFRPTLVYPNTVDYGVVATTYVPLDADLLGANPVRLPIDGKVPIYRPGDGVVIHNTQVDAMPGGLVADQVFDLSRTPVTDAELYDQNGVMVDPNLYTVDGTSDPATVTMANPLDLGAYTQPLDAVHRIEDYRLVTGVSIDGTLDLAVPLAFTYPDPVSSTTYISSSLRLGDLQARVSVLFDQTTWTGVWSDTLIGDETLFEYNSIEYPIEVLNEGAESDRFLFQFIDSNGNFQIVSEARGVLGTASMDGAPGTYISIVNPLTGKTLWRIPVEGFGVVHWDTGNCLRLNTVAASAGIWFARCTLIGPEIDPSDQFTMHIRGDRV